MDNAKEHPFRRTLLILAIVAGLMVWTTVQYVAYQRLVTEQQIAETHAWGDNAPLSVLPESP